MLYSAFAIRAQRVHIRTGVESLVGRTGVVREFSRGEGNVLVGGELWSARLANERDNPLNAMMPVEVVSVDGLKLVVKKRE